MRVLRLIALLFLPLAAACESDPLASAARNVDVDVSLGAAATRTLEFEVRNRGSRTVYVDACGEQMVPTVQRRDEWDNDGEFGAVCLGIYSARPVPVQPGGSARGQAQVSGPGEYRVALVVRDREFAERQRVVFSEGVTVPR